MDVLSRLGPFYYKTELIYSLCGWLGGQRIRKTQFRILFVFLLSARGGAVAVLPAARARRQPIHLAGRDTWYQSLPIRRRYWIRKIPLPTVGSRVLCGHTSDFLHRRRRPIHPRRRSVRPPPPSPTSTTTASTTPPIFCHYNHFPVTVFDRSLISCRSATTSTLVTLLAGAQTQTTNPHLPHGDD